MDPLAGCAFRTHFADLPDPRIGHCQRHGLLDVVTFALCEVLCGADTRVDAAELGRSKEAWLRTFLALPNGAWSRLRVVVAIENARRLPGMTEREVRYLVTSLPDEAAAAVAAVRGHWGIEHRVHWVLDVAFREDQRRTRVGHAAENLAVLRHLAPNLLRREQTAKIGVKAKRLKTAWDDSYLPNVLAGSKCNRPSGA